MSYVHHISEEGTVLVNGPFGFISEMPRPPPARNSQKFLAQPIDHRN